MKSSNTNNNIILCMCITFYVEPGFRFSTRSRQIDKTLIWKQVTFFTFLCITKNMTRRKNFLFLDRYVFLVRFQKCIRACICKLYAFFWRILECSHKSVPVCVMAMTVILTNSLCSQTSEETWQEQKNLTKEMSFFLFAALIFSHFFCLCFSYI